jgi:ribosomal protein L35
MKKGKTLKTLVKRIKISKKGKVITKNVRTGHLKAKWSTKRKFRKRGYTEQETPGYKKQFKMLIPGSRIK